MNRALIRAAHLRVAVSLVVTAIVGAAELAAQTQVARVRAPGYQELATDARSRGSVRVLVGLRTSTPVIPEGRLTRSGVTRQRTSIARTRGRFVGDLTAILAIALPYAGTLAKVFSEMVDEAPRESAAALAGAGATPLAAFLFGLLPRALPDLAAYAFYRFECALRSSAVLGFFGFPTLGYYLAASFENLHYGEVWTYLYTLFLLVVAADVWSGALRRRLVE